MNREQRKIKYRVVDTQTGRISDHKEAMRLLYNHACGVTSLEGYVFLQFTGLKDKNGKEIYEGDIIVFEETIFQIKYIPTKACFSLEGVNRFTDIMAQIKDGSFTELYTVKYFEIIGNIYENPELIKK